jgi:hypothetical protein
MIMLASAGLVLAGCGGAQQDSASEAGTARRDAVVAPEAAPNQADAWSKGGSGVPVGEAGSTQDGDAGAPPAPPGLPATARIIRNAQITLEVRDLAVSAARVRALAEGLGGYVSSEASGYQTDVTAPPSDRSRSDRATSARAGEAVLVLRVPEARLTTALDNVPGKDKVLSRTSSAEDVTAQMADLDSRIKNQKASLRRIRELYRKADSIKDIESLEQELTRRESDLEALQASLASMADRADLSTLTVVLRTPDMPAPEPEEDGFVAGLRSSWKAVLVSTTLVLTLLGALVPLVVVAALVLVPLMVWRRRRRPVENGPAPLHEGEQEPSSTDQPPVPPGR